MIKGDDSVMSMVDRAFKYAGENGLEYVTPEILLLALCEDELFAEALMVCGADPLTLRIKLENYAKEYIEKTDTNPEISDGTTYVLTYAAATAANSGRDALILRISYMGCGS